jgi:hypothetical protein
MSSKTLISGLALLGMLIPNPMSSIAAETRTRPRDTFRVDLLSERLPDTGGTVQLLVSNPSPNRVTGRLEIGVEEFRGGKWRSAGFVTRCTSAESQCTLGRKLPPALGYVVPGKPRTMKGYLAALPTHASPIAPYLVATKPGRYRFHVEVTQNSLAGRVLSNHVELQVGEPVVFPGNQEVTLVRSSVGGSLPTAGRLERWNSTDSTWTELPNALTSTNLTSTFSAQQRGLHRICDEAGVCTGVWLSDNLRPDMELQSKFTL